MTLQQAINLMKDYFYGDMSKVIDWMNSPCPELSERSPIALIRERKELKVINLIEKKFK